MENSILLKIWSFLESWGVCWRCRLRLVAYGDDLSAYKDVKSAECIGVPVCSEPAAQTCILCLGMLQSINDLSYNVPDLIGDQDDADKEPEEKRLCVEDLVKTSKGGFEATLEAVVHSVETSGHEVNSFQLHVVTPISLIMREKAVWMALEEEDPTWATEEMQSKAIQIKTVWKWIVRDDLAKKLNATYLSGDTNRSDCLVIAVELTHSEDAHDCEKLAQINPSNRISRDRGVRRFKWALHTRNTVDQDLAAVTPKQFRAAFSVPPSRLTGKSLTQVLHVTCQRSNPLYVAGRYIKLCRRLPQTPWLVEGSRRLESSVDELICGPLYKEYQPDKTTFTAAGREDVDVRMLGSGRPFIVELDHCRHLPKKEGSQWLTDIQKNINIGAKDRLIVTDLQLVTGDAANIVKKGEEEKAKSYRALIWTDSAVSADNLRCLTDQSELTIQQWTPIRVLHRRTLLQRPRQIYRLVAYPLNDPLMQQSCQQSNASSIATDPSLITRYPHSQLFVLELRCQAGTYVKEFVQGDLGRTQPNLSVLLNKQCDILALDVMAVELDWPPKAPLTTL